MKSWKTTVAGACGALGVYLETLHDPAWLATLGHVLVGAALLLGGASARDNNVTSEQAGAGS